MVGKKKSEDFLTRENYVEFEWQHQSVKLLEQKQAQPLPLLVAAPTTLAEVSSCAQDGVAQQPKILTQPGLFQKKVTNTDLRDRAPPPQPCGSLRFGWGRRTWLRGHRHPSRQQRQPEQHLNTHLDQALRCWGRCRAKGTESGTVQEGR